MTLYGPDGQHKISSSEKFGGFEYIPNSETIRGTTQVKEKIRIRIDYYEKLLKVIDHRAMGMAAKGFTRNEIKAAKYTCNQTLDTYHEILEGLE